MAKTVRENDETTVMLSGEIDDSSSLATLIRKMDVTPKLDLGEVSGITTGGIKAWKEMLAVVGASGQLILERCSTNIIDAFNLHPELLAQAHVKINTMALPYYCDSCDAASTHWVEPSTIKATFTAPERECSSCEGLLELDTAPDKYFMFLKRRI